MRPQVLFALVVVASSAPAQQMGKLLNVSGSVVAHSNAQPTTKWAPKELLSSAGLSFVENRGQFDKNVKFQAGHGNRVMWLTNTGIVFDVERLVPAATDAPPATGSDISKQQPERLVFSEEFTDGRKSPQIEASQPLPGIYNYFIGNDPEKWRTGVARYSQLLYHDVWPGIDVRFRANGPDIEQEFLVHPGADTSRIRVSYHGVDKVQLAKGGSLVVQTAFGPLQESVPRIYQEMGDHLTSVTGHFAITGEFAYGFQLGRHNISQTLVIDPTLLFSTYIGGTGEDVGTSVAVDSAGNSYIAGYSVYASNYPTSQGVLQASCPTTASTNCYSGVVTSVDAAGLLRYSTYLGSTTGGEQAKGIAVDANGEAYVTGIAYGGFPTTSSSFQPACGGSSFVTKLNATGTALIYSTCLSGGGPPAANAIALDTNGRAYVVGSTLSSSFPTTTGAVQPKLAGQESAFLLVIDPTLSGGASLAYSTYLGGEFLDFGLAVAVDAYGSAYITGNTYSSHFPVTPGAYQSTDPQGTCVTGNLPYTTGPCFTAFVAKLNPNISGSSGLIYSTYLGGHIPGLPSGVGDYGYAIAVDRSGNAYVAGTTNSLNFPTTSGAFQTSTNCSNGEFGTSGFVTKLNAGGSSLMYSTFLSANSQVVGGGYACTTSISGIALDSSNNAYVAGSTRSAGFPVTSNAFQSTISANTSGAYGYDAILSELNASGSNLIYSSYLGGGGDDLATGVAVDAAGDAYVTGNTSSPDFPVTLFAFQPILNGGAAASCPIGYGLGVCADAFVAKFTFNGVGPLTLSTITPSKGGNGGSVTISVNGNGFQDGSSLVLRCPGQVDIVPIAISTINVNMILATFDLTQASAGTCSVVGTNPDNTTATLNNSFVIEEGGSPQLSVNVTGPSKVRIGTEAIFDVVVTNQGLVDADFVTVQAGVGLPGTEIQPIVNIGPPGVVIPGGGFARFPMPFTPTVDGQCYQSQAKAQEQSPSDDCSVERAEVARLAQNLTITQKALVDQTISLSQKKLQYATQCAAITAANAANCAELNESIVLLEISIDSLEATIQQIKADLERAQDELVECEAKHKKPGGAQLGDSLSGDSAAAPLSGNALAPAWISSFCAVSSYDPNSKVGDSGSGQRQYVRGAIPLPYSINFENLPSATAPAARVSITDQLDPNLDWTTLSVDGITFGGTVVTIPSGTQSFSTYVDLRPGMNVIVGVQTQASPGFFNVAFVSTDPATGKQITDPTLGFLNPGVSGSVALSVRPKQGLPTNTQITNQAIITFDQNAPIPTPTWSNTLDNSNPVSQVSALPPASSCPDFRVSWSGSDIGSGLQGFTIYASDNGGPFTPWLTNTTAASADYTGAVGHTYSFYSIATDLTGNIEAAKTSPEATTMVTSAGPCGPPSLSAQVSNVAQSDKTVTATLTLTNTGFTAAKAVNINQIKFRTLDGSGAVTLATPALPATEGPLGIGASKAVTLTLNVPATVTRFAMTESGNLLDSSGNSYNYSLAQTVIP